MSEGIDRSDYECSIEEELVRQAAEAEKRPTMKLKWFFADESNGPACTRWRWEHTTYHVLKQWWEDGAGKGEWREIEHER